MNISHNTFCQRAKCAQYTFSSDFHKISLWIWSLAACLKGKLFFGERPILCLCKCYTYLIAVMCKVPCDKLWWLLKEGILVSGPVYCCRKGEFCTAFVVVFMLLCYLTDSRVVTAELLISRCFGAHSGSSQELPFQIFMGRLYLPFTSALWSQKARLVLPGHLALPGAGCAKAQVSSGWSWGACNTRYCTGVPLTPLLGKQLTWFLRVCDHHQLNWAAHQCHPQLLSKYVQTGKYGEAPW